MFMWKSLRWKIPWNRMTVFIMEFCIMLVRTGWSKSDSINIANMLWN